MNRIAARLLYVRFENKAQVVPSIRKKLYGEPALRSIEKNLV